MTLKLNYDHWNTSMLFCVVSPMYFYSLLGILMLWNPALISRAVYTVYPWRPYNTIEQLGNAKLGIVMRVFTLTKLAHAQNF